jgi:hypothetical protein
VTVATAVIVRGADGDSNDSGDSGDGDTKV